MHSPNHFLVISLNSGDAVSFRFFGADPDNEIIVSTSTVARRAFNRSLMATPKRCSSSIISSPRLAASSNQIVLGRRLPIRS